eukprot:CAMPEP_0116850174 /NCGR_PEP_ID=MMETSP0418-20121206/16008_1 /TAXON_ID=1158023 /ORGANISM="Astrosyne radiata, Strain 13vi08-1A" /LENGTH=99 /DNA_ID=CAMNT_0004482031 /DNA_START=21 /DNA_END=321 /DNA_ORIENTATION=-
MSKWVGYHGRSRENIKVAKTCCAKLDFKAFLEDSNNNNNKGQSSPPPMAKASIVPSAGNPPAAKPRRRRRPSVAKSAPFKLGVDVIQEETGESDAETQD